MNKVLCDSKINKGCGKCVKTEERDMRCSDRRCSFFIVFEFIIFYLICEVFVTGKNLCSEFDYFKCLSTDNCVLPQWVGDDIDDCADGSDEGKSFMKEKFHFEKSRSINGLSSALTCK